MIAQTRLLYQAQANFNRRFDELMTSLFDKINDIIMRAANAAGQVPIASAARVIEEAQGEILSVFTEDSPLDGASGKPNSDYALLLYSAYGAVLLGVLDAHKSFIEQAVSPQVFNWLGSANFTPSLSSRYDPLHLWLDPKGHNLSDRIWSSALSARQKLDKYLEFNIRAGTSAARMSRDLESLLLPSRVPLRTTRPLGVNLSYDAARLARTEISRAHTEATFAAAFQNPFVESMDWALSARHPRIDVCDNLASIGMSGQRLREPYPLESAPHVIEASHPQCICNNRPYTGDVDEANERLLAAFERQEQPPLTPVSDSFLTSMYGSFALYFLNNQL